MLELPIETWDAIASLADRPTLLNLALVSRVLLAASRRALAHEIKLGDYRLYSDPRPDPKVVLSFITKYELCCWVQDLSLINLASEWQAASIPFEKMFNLRKLVVHNPRRLFTTSAEQKAFVRQLERVCTKLRSLTWRIKSHDSDCGFFGDEFSVSGLDEVDWEDYDEPSKPCLSMLRASLSTVTNLSISICPSRNTAFPNLAELFSLVFPHLTLFKFEFEYGVPLPGDEKEEKHIMTRFIDFLVGHPKVASLTLAILDGPLALLFFSGSKPTLPRDILPNLKELHAHPRQVIGFAHVKAHFLRKLTTLSVQGENGMLDEVDACFSSLSKLAKPSRPFALTRLELTFPDVEASHYLRTPFVEWMEKSASMFPRLEKLTLADLTPIIYWLPNDFPKFDNLRHLDCHVDRYDFRQKYAIQLARRCRSLELITFNRDPEYKIIRNKAKTVLKVEG